MFSTSNHSPFDFPPGKIKLIDGIPEKSELNAIKYADYAIGRFFEDAKKEAYYKDTIFVIVADHNIKVRGSDMLPVKFNHTSKLGIVALSNTATLIGSRVIETIFDWINE